MRNLKLRESCRGLNVLHGKLVNEDFVTNHLLCAILDLMTECNMSVNKTFMWAEDVRAEAVINREELAECVTNGEK
jgi:hypothetical protein